MFSKMFCFTNPYTFLAIVAQLKAFIWKKKEIVCGSSKDYYYLEILLKSIFVFSPVYGLNFHNVDIKKQVHN